MAHRYILNNMVHVQKLHIHCCSKINIYLNSKRINPKHIQYDVLHEFDHLLNAQFAEVGGIRVS